MKTDTVYRVVERRPVPERSAILRDEVIELTGLEAATKCPFRLRRVEVDDPDKDGTLVFLTNHLEFGATTIAAIYKDRWQVELFFKALKYPQEIARSTGGIPANLDSSEYGYTAGWCAPAVSACRFRRRRTRS